jgi:hypothetical protein
MQPDRPLVLARASFPGTQAGAGLGLDRKPDTLQCAAREGPRFHLGPQAWTMKLYGAIKAALNRVTSGLAGTRV